MFALKSNKGMTFVELLVSIIIISILIPTISACIFSTTQTYVWAHNYSDMFGVISAVDGTIERELTFADNLSVSGGAVSYMKSGSSPRKLETKDGVLYINDTAVFDPGFYKGIKITAEFSIDANIVSVTVTYRGVVQHSSVFAVSKM